MNRTFPPSLTISTSYGDGSDAPAIWPDWNCSTAAELGAVGLMVTSPPPVVVVARPFCFSQYRTATSWVFPSDGVSTIFPLRSAALVTPGLTTTDAPPVAAPEMILMAVPPDFWKALIAGFGPT